MSKFASRISRKDEDMELSKRLETLISMAEKGNVVADIGCDHGYVVIRLIKEKMFQKGLAMDVRKGPLEAAKKNIGRYLLSDSIEVRLSDGMRELKVGEADCMICAGMGGALMKRILQQDEDKVREMRQLLLQPQSEIHLVRQYLREIGFSIVREEMVKEDGKYYPMFRAVKDTETTKDRKDETKINTEDYYGPLLLLERHPVLKEYIEKEKRITKEILEKLKKLDLSREKNQKDYNELEKKMARITQAEAFFDRD